MNKSEVISKINTYAPVSIHLGFDYPGGDDLSKYEVEELKEFLAELTDFIKDNI